VTTRQQIINALADAMNIITVAKSVTIGKDPATVSEMPCIVIKDGRADTSKETLDGYTKHRLQVELTYWTTGVTAWADAQTGISLMLAAFQVDNTLGGLVVVDELTGHEVYAAQAGTIEAIGLAELALTYYTDSGSI